MSSLDATRARSRLPLGSVLHDPPEPLLHRVIVLLGWLMRRLTRPDWRHADRIPASGGVLVVVNHVSHVDFLGYGHFLTWGAGRWPRFMAKAELFDAPLLGWLLRATAQIRVDRRSDSAAAAVTAAQEAIAAGQAVTIYPEGTITSDPDGWPMPPRSGAARIALASGCPVVPVGQWGVQELMPGKRPGMLRFWRRPVARVVAGPPVSLDDLRGPDPDGARLREASARIHAALLAVVGEVRQQ
ncbi:lysophospholipid acyltransferase family protein, partial [Desertihabitans aurantiacus]|uniref:lysophospholipid acyltransferase family protein n=1 Tax=Desertihabitans aurantiacus TaxID=2282477 RepID=UPI0013007A61